MFTEDKITEIYCLANDFCNFFDSLMKRYSIKDQKFPVRGNITVVQRYCNQK